MIRSVFLTFSLLALSQPATAACDQHGDLIGARYLVTKTQDGAAPAVTRELVLWRNQRQVAHENTRSGITELWEQTSNGQLRMVRYFDKHRRGIEYQPYEIRHASNNGDWQIKAQLISEAQLKSLQRIATQGGGCDKRENYASAKGDATQISLQWLPHRRLVQHYRETGPESTVTLQLLETITDEKRIKRAFADRETYQNVDYADIGDNESDPFLAKMINLGFIEHGAAGFYDTQGHTLNGHHRH